MKGESRILPQEAKKNSVFTYAASSYVDDPVNQKILVELQQEPRLTMTELGRRIGMSAPAVAERVRRLEENGVITGYRLGLAPAQLGLPLGVYIRVRPNPGQLSHLIDIAQQTPEIVECHRITGEDCLLIKAFLPSIDQLDRLLDKFLRFGMTTTSIIQSSPVPLRDLPVGE